MGETRRGFRFTYSEYDRRKKQHYTRQKSTKELIKTSLKEQLLEMRTTSDIKSTPPVLKKNVAEVKDCQIYNTIDTEEESPVLLKCNVNTINFNGKTYFLPLTEKDPNRILPADENKYSKNPFSRTNSRAGRWKVNRLPLHMKPFVSLKRLHLDLKPLRKQKRLRIHKDATLQKLQTEENGSENGSYLHVSNKVTQGTISITGDSLVNRLEHEINTYGIKVKAESDGLDKQKENNPIDDCTGAPSSDIKTDKQKERNVMNDCLGSPLSDIKTDKQKESYAIDDCQGSPLSDLKTKDRIHISRKTNTFSKNGSFILTEEAKELSQVGNIQNCKTKSEGHKTNAPKAALQPENFICSSIKAIEPVDQFQHSMDSNKRKRVNLEFKKKYDSQSKETTCQISKKDSKRYNKLPMNEVGCALDNVEVSGKIRNELSASESVEQRSLKVNGIDNELMIAKLSENQNIESKVLDCVMQSDSEKHDFDSICKKDSMCDSSDCVTRFSKRCNGNADIHSLSQIGRNCTDVYRKSVVKKKSTMSSSKISVQSRSRKRTSRRVLNKEPDSVKCSVNDSSKIRQRQKYKNAPCAPSVELQLYPNTSATHSSLPPSQQTEAKLSTHSFQIQPSVSNVNLERVSNTMNSTKGTALGKSEQPKTILDLFREPLCKRLVEKIKSNGQLKNDFSFSYQLGISTHSTHTATSPPLGVIAPAQLDFSPKVAEAKTYDPKELQVTHEIYSSGLDFTQYDIPCDVSKTFQTGQGLQAELLCSQTSGGNENQCNSNKLQIEPPLVNCKSTTTPQLPDLNADGYRDLPTLTSKTISLKPSDESKANLPCAMTTSHSVIPHTHQLTIVQNQEAFSSQISEGKEQSKLKYGPDICYSVGDNMIAPEDCLPVRERISTSITDSEISHKNQCVVEEIGNSNNSVPLAALAPHRFSETSNSFEKPISNPTSNLQAENHQVSETNCTSASNLSRKSQVSNTKSNLQIDADIAAKLQRVLRKHISEVQKYSVSSIKSTLKVEDSANCELKQSSVYKKRNFDLTRIPISLDGFENDKMTKKEDIATVSNSIDSNGNEYNLYLLANQTVQDSKITSKLNETAKNSESKPFFNVKENAKRTPIINATVDVLAEYLNDGSQDTVIGGIRLSPLRHDPVFEYRADYHMKESKSIYPIDTTLFSQETSNSVNPWKKSTNNFVGNGQSKYTPEKGLLSHDQEYERDKEGMQRRVTMDKIQHEYDPVSFGPHTEFDHHAPKLEVDESVTIQPSESFTCSDIEKMPDSMQETCVEYGGFGAMFNIEDQVPTVNTITGHTNDSINIQREESFGNVDHNFSEKNQCRDSRIFGRIHTLGNSNTFENKRSLSSCSNAILSTFQDLSKIAKAFNNTYLQNIFENDSLKHNKIKQKSSDITVQEIVAMQENTLSSQSAEYLDQTTGLTKSECDTKSHEPFSPSLTKPKVGVESRPNLKPENEKMGKIKVIKNEEASEKICKKNLTMEECCNNKFLLDETFSKVYTHGKKDEANTQFDDGTGNIKPLQETKFTEMHSKTKKEASVLNMFPTSDQENESCTASTDTFQNHLYSKSMGDDTTSNEAKEKNSIREKSSHVQLESPTLSETMYKKKEMQSKITPAQTSGLQTTTGAVLAKTEETDLLNRDLTEKRNKSGTKLGIQRMRAKLSNTLIKNSKIIHSSMEHSESASSMQEALKSRPRNSSEYEGNNEGPVLDAVNDKSRICGNTETCCSPKDVTSVEARPEESINPACPTKETWTASKSSLIYHDADAHCSETGLKEKEKNVLPSNVISEKNKKYISSHSRCGFSNDFFFMKNNSSRPMYLRKRPPKTNEILTHEKIDNIWSNRRIPIISERGTKLYEDFGKCGGSGHEHEIRTEGEEKITFEHKIDTTKAREDCRARSIESRVQTTNPEQITSKWKKTIGSSNFRIKEKEHYAGRGTSSQNTSKSSIASDLLYKSNFDLCQAQTHSSKRQQQNNPVRSFKRFPSMRGKTGYYSWRRKYQTAKIFRPEKRFATNRGLFQTDEEQREWKLFKERERIRLQIEQAVKDYRRTFEHTEDDFVGDEKVSQYLHSLSEKLEHVQSKRHLLIRPGQNRCNNDKVRDNKIELKGETTKSFVRGRYDDAPFDSSGTEHQMKIEQFDSIEKILQEYVHRHFEKVTEKLRLELTAKFVKEMQTKPTAKDRDEVFGEDRSYAISRTDGEKDRTYYKRSFVPASLQSREQFHANDYQCDKYYSSESSTSESPESEKLKYTNLFRSRDRYSERHFLSRNYRNLNAEKNDRTYLNSNKRSRSRSVSPCRPHSGNMHKNSEKRHQDYATCSRHPPSRYSRSRSRSSENTNYKSRSPVLRHRDRYSSFHNHSRSRSRSRETPPRKKMRNDSDKPFDFDSHYDMNNVNTNIKENRSNKTSFPHIYNIDHMKSKWNGDDASCDKDLSIEQDFY